MPTLCKVAAGYHNAVGLIRTYSGVLDLGMGAGHLLKLLCGFLKQDMEALAAGAQGTPNIVKRSQFWLMLLNKLAVSFPEACGTAWETLLGWLINTRCKLGSSVESQSNSAGVSELLSKAAKCLVLILNSTKCEDILRVSVDRLRARMLAGHDSSDRQQLLAVPTLLAATDLLEQASLMKPRVRLSCAQLLTGVVDTLIMPSCKAAALQDPSLLRRAAEGLVLFLAATCSAAMSGLADKATAQQHIAALHRLLQAAVITETGSSWDASPITAHLVTLLSVLLSSSPPGVVEVFVKAHLQVSACTGSDAAQLSCLCAGLRVAALACPEATSSHFSPAVQATLGQLPTAFSQYSASALALLAEEPPGSQEVLAFLRLLECTHLVLAYLGATTNTVVTPRLQFMVLEILGASSMHNAVPPCWAPAALRVLASLLDLAGEQPLLTDEQLEALMPTLASLLKHQEAPDPLLQFTALEAYADYIKVCDKSLVMAMLPPGLLDPGTGVACEAFRAVLAQHLTRTVNAPLAIATVLQDHAAVLHGIADSAGAQLSSSAKLYSGISTEAGDIDGDAAAVALAAQGSAAAAVCAAITSLEQAVQAAGVPLESAIVRASSGKGPQPEREQSATDKEALLALFVRYPGLYGTAAVVLGYILGVPALGNLHWNTGDALLGLKLAVPLAVLDALLMLPNYSPATTMKQVKMKVPKALAEKLQQQKEALGSSSSSASAGAKNTEEAQGHASGQRTRSTGTAAAAAALAAAAAAAPSTAAGLATEAGSGDSSGSLDGLVEIEQAFPVNVDQPPLVAALHRLQMKKTVENMALGLSLPSELALLFTHHLASEMLWRAVVLTGVAGWCTSLLYGSGAEDWLYQLGGTNMELSVPMLGAAMALALAVGAEVWIAVQKETFPLKLVETLEKATQKGRGKDEGTGQISGRANKDKEAEGQARVAKMLSKMHKRMSKQQRYSLVVETLRGVTESGCYAAAFLLSGNLLAPYVAAVTIDLLFSTYQRMRQQKVEKEQQAALERVANLAMTMSQLRKAKLERLQPRKVVEGGGSQPGPRQGGSVDDDAKDGGSTGDEQS
ncbi:hypothetical protein N2152v2_007592 [Parachlorella kessleri]